MSTQSSNAAPGGGGGGAGQQHVMSVSRLEGSVETLLQSNFDADSRVFITTLLKLIDNILLQPFNEIRRKIRTGNESIQTKLLSKKGGFQVLLECGFQSQVLPPPLLSGGALGVVQSKGDEILVFPHDDVSFLRTVRRLLISKLVHELGVSSDNLPKEPPHVAPATLDGSGTTTTNFSIYSGHRFDAASAALGMQITPEAQYVSKTETALKVLTQKQQQLEQKLQLDTMIDRKWIATRPGEVTSTAATSVLANMGAAIPEQPPKTDSKLLAARLQKQQQERNKQEAGFTTQAMRDLEKLQKSKVYSHTLLTIQLDDGCKVVACFLPNETIEQVKVAIWNDCLIEDLRGSSSAPSAKSLDFDLIQTPPRRVLDPKQTLKHHGLVPAAKIVLSWKTPLRKKQQSEIGWYLNPQLFATAAAASSSSSSTIVPSFPQSQPIVDPNDASNGADADAASITVEDKKPPPESREDALLRRMMGGGIGGGRTLGGGGGGSAGAGAAAAARANASSDKSKKPKWFKG